MTLRDQHMIQVLESAPPATPLARPKSRGRGRPPRTPRQPEPEEGTLAAKQAKIDVPKVYHIVPNREVIDAVLRKHHAKHYLKLKPERLKYTPFLTTREPAAPPPLAALVSGDRREAKDAERPRAVDSADLSSESKDALSTPADIDMADESELVTPEAKVAAGEDQATLDLVAALSASATRALRKRSSGIPSPERDRPKRLCTDSPVALSRRRSTRGGASEDPAIVQTPSRNISRSGLRTPGRTPGSRKTMSVHSTPRRTRAAATEEGDDAWGEEDAEGEVDDGYSD